MDILFVLLGIAIFYAAAAVFAIEHYETNPAQAAVSFFIPPFAWWLYYHYWQRSQKIAYTQIVAFCLFFGGIVLITWFSNSSAKISQLQTHVKGAVKEFDSAGYVGSDASLKDLAQAERISATLNGRIRGESFLFDVKKDVAEFDALGTLRIKHGNDFFGDFEIAIEFGELPPQVKTPWKKTIRPDTPNPPVIYVSWYDSKEKMLRSRKYVKDYSLDFSLVNEEYNMFLGKMQLVLPDPEQSYLVGNITVFNSRLRFHGEGINKEYDSTETLEAIAAQTFIISYNKYIKTILGFEGTFFDYRSGDGLGYSTIYVQDDDSQIRKIPLIFYKNDKGWFLDVKGLKEQLRANENLIAKQPAGLSQPIQVDQKNIGNIQQAENQESLEVNKTITTEMAQVKEAVQPIEATKKVELKSETKIEVGKPIEAEAQKNTTPNANQANILNLNVVTQEDDIEKLLLPLMNKDVELTTRAGKFKNGVYVGVNRKQIVLEVQLGGGVVEFLTEFYNMKSLRVLNSPNTKPQQVEFFNPNAS